MDISFLVFLSMALFVIGIVGVLINRNALILFLSIEMMLNSSNLLFVAFARERSAAREYTDRQDKIRPFPYRLFRP